jgi:predicted permease
MLEAVSRAASTLLEVVAPVLLIAAAGYFFGRKRAVDLRSISAIAVYLLSPAITFNSLSSSTLPREEIGRIGLFVLLQMLTLGGLTLVPALLGRWERSKRNAYLLCVLFTNSGNFGLPLAQFAFGSAGLDIAVIFFAVQAMFGNTLAVFLASQSRLGAAGALRSVVGLPITYAVLLGAAVNLLGIHPPAMIQKAVQTVAGAAVPIMLLLLGIQLARVQGLSDIRGAVAASVLRLGVAPLIAAVTAQVLGLRGLVQSVAILQASMPTAVSAALWAIEFDTRPSFVTSTVLLSTLVSIGTLTVLLVLLRT